MVRAPGCVWFPWLARRRAPPPLAAREVSGVWDPSPPPSPIDLLSRHLRLSSDAIGAEERHAVVMALVSEIQSMAHAMDTTEAQEDMWKSAVHIVREIMRPGTMQEQCILFDKAVRMIYTANTMLWCICSNDIDEMGDYTFQGILEGNAVQVNYLRDGDPTWFATAIEVDAGDLGAWLTTTESMRPGSTYVAPSRQDDERRFRSMMGVARALRDVHPTLPRDMDLDWE